MKVIDIIKPFFILLCLCLLPMQQAFSDIHIYATPDSSDFENFLLEGDNKIRYKHFVSFLKFEGVDNILPAEQLIRQGSGWQDVSLPPLALPHDSLWPNIVPTLRLIRDKIMPITGPVEAVSAFRTRQYNDAAGGDPNSKHMVFRALDLVPIKKVERDSIVPPLVKLWETEGESVGMGLGLYWFIRFHVHTGDYEIWGN